MQQANVIFMEDGAVHARRRIEKGEEMYFNYNEKEEEDKDEAPEVQKPRARKARSSSKKKTPRKKQRALKLAKK